MEKKNKMEMEKALLGEDEPLWCFNCDTMQPLFSLYYLVFLLPLSAC